MRKLILTFLGTLLFTGIAFCAPKPGYKIVVQIKNAKDTVMYMGHYFGNYTLAYDTAFVNKKGQFVFENKTKEVKPGVYFFSNPQGRYAEFIINKDKPFFTLKTDEVNWITNMEVSGSPENKAFYDYQKLTHVYYNKIDSISKNTADKGVAKEASLVLRMQLDSIKNSLIYTYPDYLFAKMLKATKEIEVPAVNEKGDTMTRLEKSTYFGDHYFDNMPLDMDALVRTPSAVFYDRVERFFDGYLGKADPDAICEYVDKLIEKARPSKEVFQFLVHHITEKYLRSNVMTHDAVYVHMIEKYYATGDAFWAKPSDIDEEVQRASKWKNLLVGKIAPDFGVSDTTFDTQQWHFLHSNNANKYTLLIFWSPTCGHCATIIPALHDFTNKYAKKYDIGTFAVNTEINEIEKWKTFVKEKNLEDWDNYNGGVANVDWKDLYDIVSTPVIYLLGRDKKILAKKVDAKILTEIFKILEPDFKE